jgi:hypothetical protein
MTDPAAVTTAPAPPAITGQCRYETQLTNDPHPANSAGLRKHLIDEIAAAAGQKRAERQAILDQR